MTPHLVPLLSLTIGLVVGYVIGVQHGESRNMGPEMQRLNRQLDQAWETIARLQHRNDDWAERGIGR